MREEVTGEGWKIRTFKRPLSLHRNRRPCSSVVERGTFTQRRVRNPKAAGSTPVKGCVFFAFPNQNRKHQTYGWKFRTSHFLNLSFLEACFKAKCACRQFLESCGPDCRCGGDCHNSAKGPLAKATRLAFLYPDSVRPLANSADSVQWCSRVGAESTDACGSGLTMRKFTDRRESTTQSQSNIDKFQDSAGMVVRLVGQGYEYQMEFLDSDKGSIHAPEHFYETLLNLVARHTLPLQHIHIFMNRSPCFHQDCDPRCEVLAHCESQKACARFRCLWIPAMNLDARAEAKGEEKASEKVESTNAGT